MPLGYLDRTVRNLDAIYEIAKIERLNAAAAEAKLLRDGVEDPDDVDPDAYAAIISPPRVSRVQLHRDEQARNEMEMARKRRRKQPAESSTATPKTSLREEDAKKKAAGMWVPYRPE
jgi:hypothetical protein